MHRKVLLAFALCCLSFQSAQAQQWARKMFATTSHDFGTIARGAEAEFRFELTNLYVEDVHIASVRSSCGCTMPRIEKEWLKTHETGAIIARINTRAFSGRRGATVTVTFDKPYFAQVQLQVKCYIRRDVVFHPGSATFGSVDEGTRAEKEITVRYAGRNDWRILDVVAPNPHLSAHIEETERRRGRVSYRLRIRLDENAPPGYLRDHLVLVTNDRRLTRVPLAVEAVVRPAISVSPEPLFMGVVHSGETITKQVVVRGKVPFRILAVECPGGYFRIENAPQQEPRPVHLVPVTFVAGQQTGKVEGKIRIHTDLGTATSELSASAVVAP